jgi:hypothetical protein
MMVKYVDTYLKRPTFPLFEAEVQQRRKTNVMVLEVNKYMVIGPHEAQYHE